MNSFLALSVAVVTISFPLSGKSIQTDPRTANSCISAIIGPNDPPPTGPHKLHLMKVTGDQIHECIRIQNEMDKRK